MTNEQLAIFLSKIKDQLSDVIDDMRSDLRQLENGEMELSTFLDQTTPLFGLTDFTILDGFANLWVVLGEDIDALLGGED